MDHFVVCVSCLPCFLVCSLRPCSHPQGKGQTLGSLVCCILLRFCHFPVWCPMSGVVLDCIDSLTLPPYLLWYLSHMRKILI